MDSSEKILPTGLVSKLKEMYDSETYTRILEGFTNPRKTTLRVNTLKSTATELSIIFKARGIQFTRVSWFQDAFIVHGKSAKYLSGLPEYNQGLFYVQNLSSMIPPIVLDPQPGEKILDITAAPGSKTTQIAALMRNTGSIIANDRSTVRRMKLLKNLSVQGVTNTTVTKIPAQIIWKKYPETFDRVLADVPCSMEGMVQIHVPKTYGDWSPGKVRVLSAIQKTILRSAVSCAKPGAVIVYSTCTLSPEENEEVVDWIIRKEKGAVVPEKLTLSIWGQFRSIPEWKSHTYHHLSESVLRIIPTNTMEGFFIAKLRKVKSTVHDSLRNQ